MKKSKNKAAVLGLLLGFVGGHRWYLGQTGKALVGLFIQPIGIVYGFCFGVYWLLSSEEAFDNTYNKQRLQREQVELQKEMLNALKNK
tara:strand:+ start:793 stop:1056 length:264 start_codon:yes stop_codon:yes gene_type:complete